jgi:hypothetical protein
MIEPLANSGRDTAAGRGGRRRRMFKLQSPGHSPLPMNRADWPLKKGKKGNPRLGHRSELGVAIDPPTWEVPAQAGAGGRVPPAGGLQEAQPVRGSHGGTVLLSVHTAKPVARRLARRGTGGRAWPRAPGLAAAEPSACAGLPCQWGSGCCARARPPHGRALAARHRRVGQCAPVHRAQPGQAVGA